MEKTFDQPTRAESTTRLVEQVNVSVEANRLITESQDLFAQRKSAEAIQLLRKAYELDKNNSLARAILANALVEHAQSMVENNWLEAETLTNQALTLNPAHPTAKTILSLIVRKKETGSVADWISQARKLQSSGDLFAALGGVAEGLAVHPHDPKLLQIQDEIQRDQDARRRQARRGDLDDLRRLQREIDGAADVAAKQALASRIQTVAAKHWTDGEILSIANALLLRLGLVSEEKSGASPRSKGTTLILHVPRPSAPKPSRADSGQTPPSKAPAIEVPPSPVVPAQVPQKEAAPGPAVPMQGRPSPVPSTSISQTQVQQNLVPPSSISPTQVLPSPVAAGPTPAGNVPTAIIPPSKIPLRTPARGKLRTPSPKAHVPSPQATTVPAVEPFATSAKFTPSPRPKQPTRSNSTTLIVVASASAIILIGVLFLLARKHPAPPVAKTPAAASSVSAPTDSVSTPSAPPVLAPAPAVSAPAQSGSQKSPPATPLSSDTTTGSVTPSKNAPADSALNLGTLLVIAGQDGAKVFLNGKLQRQLTQSGQLRLPNLDPRDYVVQVSKPGFQDPPQQKIRIQKGEQASLLFNLQPQIRMASLAIQGGPPGTTVFLDQTLIGTIQPDGTLSVSNVNPGDHTVELRKERFQSRQFKKHFVAGGTISLAAADATLEAAPSELKITYAPADASVAIVKGDFLKIVSSGVPLTVAPGTYTLTARTADRFTRSSTFEVIAGQSKVLNLSLAPNGMSKWDDPGSWKHEGDSFTRKGGQFVLYAAVPASGNFVFSATITKGRVMQWVLNYTDPRNYVLFQLDENNFYRSLIHNGQKTDEIIVPHKGDKKSSRTIQIRVSPTEIVHQIKDGDRWTILDRWTQPGINLSQGKFGFYLPGNDQVALSSFVHYSDLNIH